MKRSTLSTALGLAALALVGTARTAAEDELPFEIVADSAEYVSPSEVEYVLNQLNRASTSSDSPR